MKRDIVTAVLTEFHYANSSSGGAMLQRFEFSRVCMGENVNSHFSRNFDTVLRQKCLQLQVGKIEQILHYDWLLE